MNSRDLNFILLNFKNRYFAIYDCEIEKAKYLSFHQYHFINNLINHDSADKRSSYSFNQKIIDNYINLESINKNYPKLEFSDLSRTASNLYCPLYADIEISNVCNLKCVFCYLENQHASQMPFKTFKIILNELTKNNVKFITLTGGEPFFHPEIEHFIRHSLSENIFLTIQTNGILIKPNLIPLLSFSKRLKIRISFHSSDKGTFDKMAGKKGAHDKIINVIQLLRKNKVNFFLKLSITDINKETVKETIEWFKKNNLNFELNNLILPKIYIKAEFVEDPNLSSAVIKYLIDSKNLSLPTRARCIALKGRFRIETNGNIIPCELYRKSFGNLLEQSFEDIMASQKTLDFLESLFFDDPFECGNCDKKLNCKHCPARSIFEGNLPNAKSSYMCSLTKLYFSEFTTSE